MVYTKEGYLVGLFTVFEAHQHALKFRLKISQVIVLTPYQRRGIATRMYELIYQYYLTKKTSCFELIVEDAADDFQKVQDIINSKILVEKLIQNKMHAPSKYKTSADII